MEIGKEEYHNSAYTCTSNSRGKETRITSSIQLPPSTRSEPRPTISECIRNYPDPLPALVNVAPAPTSTVEKRPEEGGRDRSDRIAPGSNNGSYSRRRTGRSKVTKPQRASGSASPCFSSAAIGTSRWRTILGGLTRTRCRPARGRVEDYQEGE